MKKIPAAKTLLAALSVIDQYCESIKKVNYIHAVNSFYNLQDTEVLVQRIIDKTFKVQQLQNLKAKILGLIDSLGSKVGTVLTMHFAETKKPEAIAHGMNISQRTVFRLINSGVEAVAEGLAGIGINSFTFRLLLDRNPWLRAEYVRWQSL